MRVRVSVALESSIPIHSALRRSWVVGGAGDDGGGEGDAHLHRVQLDALNASEVRDVLIELVLESHTARLPAEEDDRLLAHVEPQHVPG